MNAKAINREMQRLHNENLAMKKQIAGHEKGIRNLFGVVIELATTAGYTMNEDEKDGKTTISFTRHSLRRRIFGNGKK
jgi:hypothetical protein